MSEPSFLTNLVLEKARSFPSSREAAAFFGTSPVRLEGWLNRKAAVPLAAVEKVFDPSFRPPAAAKKVCIALPWYKTTNPQTAVCIMSLFDRRTMRVMMNFDDAFVIHSRNKLADRFLASDSEWMLTVDDDLILPNGNAAWFNDATGFDLPEKVAGRNTISHLLSRGKTLIGGLYFGRRKGARAMFDGGPVEIATKDEIVPVNWVATGCLLIHRSVYTDIERRFPEIARKPDGTGGNWFTPSEKTGNVGEDVAFCIRAKQAGHQPFVDFGLRCGHVGSSVY